MSSERRLAGLMPLGPLALAVALAPSLASGGDPGAVVTELNQTAQRAGKPASPPCEEPSSGFRNVTIEEKASRDLFPKRVRFTHRIELSAVVFRGTGWDSAGVLARFRRLAEVYVQCGIQVSRLRILTADVPREWLRVGSTPDGAVSEIARKTPEKARPLFYFARSTDPLATDTFTDESDPAYAAKRKAFAFKSSAHPGIPDALSDTAWITREHTYAERTGLDPSYSVEAHELGHLLMDAGHDTTGEPNFLGSGPSRMNGAIRPDQCERMKKSPLLKPMP